jgi:hypothetical protein
VYSVLEIADQRGSNDQLMAKPSHGFLRFSKFQQRHSSNSRH